MREMRAAIVRDFNAPPRYGDFVEPLPGDGELLVTVSAVGLTQLIRGQATGRHYSGGTELGFVPGNDGVGRLGDGRRVYFATVRPPFGSMAEYSLTRAEAITPLPDGVDDVLAAAIANPGMSSSAALMHRARIQPGETVLINGATGVAGALAVAIAKYLGAGRVIGTGRDLDGLSASGADVTISLSQPEADLVCDFKAALATGVDIVLDYLCGRPAELLLEAVAGKGAPEGERRVRYVQIGSVAGGSITLNSQVLRSSGLELMGSGLGSVARKDLLTSIASVFDGVVTTGLKVETEVAALSEVEEAWTRDTGRRRLVIVP